MRRKILALEQQVRTLCMLAHAICACTTLFQSLGMLDVAYVRAILSLISVATIALCGVLLSAGKHVLEISAEYRDVLNRSARPGHNVPEKVYRHDTKVVLIGFMLRDTVSITASLSLISVLIGGFGEVGKLALVATAVTRVACVLLLLNYVTDVVLRAAVLIMGAHAACSRCAASRGEHEHNLLSNVSTSLQAMGTADKLPRS